jgi:hypothetical protein
MTLADEVLAGLLVRGERARLRDSSRAIQTIFTSDDSPYWRLDYAQRQHAHVRFAAAEHAGAVQLRWARQGGDDRPLDRIRLLDTDKLAAFLGIASRSETLQKARATLTPWLTTYPRVIELLDAWEHLKTPRGLGTESAPDVADALLVLDALRQEQGEDQIVRVFSRHLFRDSKRIEALVRHIDLLTAEQFGSPARQQEEVFGALGLVKEPQPFLMAGTGHLTLESSQGCPVAKPFIGVSGRHVVAYAGTPAWVLSIENLTTFHQASQHLDADAGLILYTGGMPSPSWCRAYTTILASISTHIPVYHWGDIDQGGFRIAAHIKRKCIHRHAFLPWLMDASQLSGTAFSEVTEIERGRMARHAHDAGWDALSRHMLAQTIEQEGIAIRLPLVDA